MEQQEIQKVNEQPIALAINPDAPLMVQVVQMMAGGVKIDTDQIKAMQEICRQQDADDAKKAFAPDFTSAQAEIGGVVKTRNNSQTNSKYAGLEDVINVSKPVYTRHGFSVTFNEGKADADGEIRLCADILHKAGHKETYHIDVPLGGKGIQGKVNMIDIHAKATSISYGKRYLLCMIWNIPTQDNDGNPPPQPTAQPITPTEAEIEVINAICDKLSPSDSRSVNYPSIRDILLGNVRHLLVLDKVEPAAEWLMKYFGDKDLFIASPKENEQNGSFEPTK